VLSAGWASGRHGARVEAPAGVHFEQKETKDEEKRKEEKDFKEAEGDMQKMACDALDVVFAKVIVPKLNSKTIPQVINKIGYNPMQQVVSTKSMQMTDLTGLVNFTITSLTTTKVIENSSVAESSGFSTTATAHMQMEAEIPVTMTAHAVFEHGDKSDDTSDHFRRLESSSQSSDVKFDGTVNINKLQVKMPIIGVVTIISGTSLNASNILDNMKHMTIESANSGIPDIGFDLSLQCQRRLGLMDHMADDAEKDAKKGMEDAGKDAAKDMHVECHAASVGLEAAKLAIDLVMDDKFTSIIQNVLNKQLPMTLGEPKDTNKVSGKMKLSVSGGRRLTFAPDSTTAASDFLADNATKAAVRTALADMASIPSGDVSTDFALEETGEIGLNYSLLAPDGNVDAYDVREALMNHSDDEFSAKITQYVRGNGARWDVRASSGYASVVEPSPELRGSDDEAHYTQAAPWYAWWPYILLLLATLLVVGLAAVLARHLLAKHGRQSRPKTRSVKHELAGEQGSPQHGSREAAAAPEVPQWQPPAAAPTSPMSPVPHGAVAAGHGSFMQPPAPFSQAPYVQVQAPPPAWRTDVYGGNPGFNNYGQVPFGQFPTGFSFPHVQPHAQHYWQGQSAVPQAQASVVQPTSPYAQLLASWDSQAQPNYGYGYAASGYAPCPSGAVSPVLQGGSQPAFAMQFPQ